MEKSPSYLLHFGIKAWITKSSALSDPAHQWIVIVPYYSSNKFTGGFFGECEKSIKLLLTVVLWQHSWILVTWVVCSVFRSVWPSPSSTTTCLPSFLASPCVSSCTCALPAWPHRWVHSLHVHRWHQSQQAQAAAVHQPALTYSSSCLFNWPVLYTILKNISPLPWQPSFWWEPDESKEINLCTNSMDFGCGWICERIRVVMLTLMKHVVPPKDLRSCIFDISVSSVCFNFRIHNKSHKFLFVHVFLELF